MRAFKIIKRIFIVLLIFLFITISASILLTYIYKEEIKQWALSQINLYFNTEIKIDEIDFSIIKNFPDATIILNKVVLKSSQTYNKKDLKLNTDTLLKAANIFLQFNLFDIFQKKYTLQTIKLNDANILLCYDKKGNNNFSVLKKNNEKASKDTLYIKLDKIKLNRTTVKIYNAAKRLAVETYANNFTLSGNFYKDKYTIVTRGAIDLKQLIVDKVNYLKTDKAKINLNIKVNNNELEIKKGTIKLGKITLLVNGNYQINDKNDNINIRIEGHKQSLSDLTKSLPENYTSFFEKVESSGIIDFSVHIQGGISYNVNPRIKASFTLHDGFMKNYKSNTKLNKINLKGSFDNGLKQNLETTYLIIDTFYTQFGDSSFIGQFSIFNFSKPLIKLKLNGFVNLEQWKALFNLDTFEVLKGNISLYLDYAGKLKSLSNISATDYKNAIVKGNMYINNASIKIQNNPLAIQNFNGNIRFNNNDVYTDNVMFELNNSQFILKGIIKNFIAYLMLPNEKLEANINLNINKINIENWQSNNNNSSSYLPTDIIFKGNINIDEFTYNKFVAKKILCSLELINGNIYFSNLQLNTIDGSAFLKGRLITNSKKETLLQSECNLQNINIKQLFQSFDNFGQDFITEKHLQGKLNSYLPYVQIKWDSTFKIIEKDIILYANIEITNGQLIEFEPIYKLADYIELDELKQIKFSNLKNDISIKDRKIIIPNMEVKTNAFTIEVSGEHTFDNYLEYRIKLLLREWLAKKAKKNKKENLEFGIEENDGLGSTALYLIIKGTENKYQISYDSKKMKEQVKESLKQEKEEIKSVLREEFGLFKKDTTLKNTFKKQQEQKSKKFIIVWDEDEPQQDKSE